jgi:hypothetical protein
MVYFWLRVPSIPPGLRARYLIEDDTTMKHRILYVVFLIAAVGAAACTSVEHKSDLTGPTATGINALLGSWTSSSIVPSPSSCTDFKWNVTEQSGTTAKGSFSATCAGDLKLSGTAQGVLQGATTIAWSAQGNATAPGLTSCAISLTGTAELGIDTVRVPYSGDTCLGKVSGIESLKR